MEIQRTLFPVLLEQLDNDEILLLTGPRQAGKTTLLKALALDIEAKSGLCLFFNLDIDTDAQHFTSQQRFVDRVQALSAGKRAYVFIDEVQRIENAGLFLKGLYDRGLPHKWIATGSGSLELKEKIAESLAGRKHSFVLPTVSMSEFLSYRLQATAERCTALLRTDAHAENSLLFEYLSYGGYPKVLTTRSPNERKRMLAELFQSYVERDLQLLLRLEKTRELVTMLQLVANRIGRLVNYQDLSKMANLSVPTVKNYLWYCQKTFILEELPPFFTNKEKELAKTSQYYFVDNGLRNFLLNNMSVTDMSPDYGFLFQQLVFQLIKSQFAGGLATVGYWRTQGQAEVDFVVRDGLKILPIEVKAQRMARPQVGRSLRSFLGTYRPPAAWVVNRSLKTQISIEATTVHFIPWYELLPPLETS